MLLDAVRPARVEEVAGSWAVVATGDKAVGTDALRSMANRAKAKITEADGSHVIMISKPQVVTDVITKALTAEGNGKRGAERS